jgi:AcrR family transcriptional regulator
MSDTETNRRSRKREQTADLLVNTAWELFEKHGYAAVTMEQIAAAADVAKGTLYNHFAEKDALLVHYFHRALRQRLPELEMLLDRETDRLKRFELFFVLASEWATEHQRYVPHYLEYRLRQPFGRRNAKTASGTEAVFVRLIADAQDAGRLRQDMAATELAFMLQFQYLAALLAWLQQPDQPLLLTLRRMLALFIHGAQGGDCHER